jgi:hypothetical protein
VVGATAHAERIEIEEKLTTARERERERAELG